jgi:anti-sigma factor RsiW
MIDCRQAENLMERRLDYEASAPEEQALTLHLALCANCSRLWQLEAQADAALAAVLSHHGPSPQFVQKVRRRVAEDVPAERLGWIVDGLNAAGVLATLALVARLTGGSGNVLASLLVAAMAITLYPSALVLLAGGYASGHAFGPPRSPR